MNDFNGLNGDTIVIITDMNDLSVHSASEEVIEKFNLLNILV